MCGSLGQRRCLIGSFFGMNLPRPMNRPPKSTTYHSTICSCLVLVDKSAGNMTYIIWQPKINLPEETLPLLSCCHDKAMNILLKVDAFVIWATELI